MFCRNYQSRRVWQPRSVDKGMTPHKWLQLGTWSLFCWCYSFAFLGFNSFRLRQLINSISVPINPEGNNQIYLADQRVDHQPMSPKWCLVTKERKEMKDTEHYHHPHQCEKHQPEKERKPTNEEGTHHHAQGDKRLVLLRKNSTRNFHFEIFPPFATRSWSVSSLLSLRAQDGFEDWRHLSLTFKNAHPRGDKKGTSCAHPRVHDDRAKAHPIAHSSSATLRLAPTSLARVLKSLSLQILARVHLLPPQLLRLVHCWLFSLQAGAGLRWKYVFINLSTNSHLKCSFVGESCTLVVIDIAFFCFTASLKSKMWWNYKNLFSNL